jgi:hypothetical protein
MNSSSIGLAVVLHLEFSGAMRLIDPKSSFNIELLHHLCFRAKSREDVDRAAKKLRAMGAAIVRGPTNGDWAPGYYYVLFEDPDDIRLEICFVPGAGLLAEGQSFGAGEDFVVEASRDR